MGGYMPKVFLKTDLKRQRDALAKVGEEVDIIQKPKPVIPNKATGLPETPVTKPPLTIDRLKKQSEDKISEMRKKGWIK